MKGNNSPVLLFGGKKGLLGPMEAQPTMREREREELAIETKERKKEKNGTNTNTTNVGPQYTAMPIHTGLHGLRAAV